MPYFEIIVDSCAVGSNAERSRVPFTHPPPMVTSCNAVIQCVNEDIDIGTIKIQKAPSPPRPLRYRLHPRNTLRLAMAHNSFYMLLDLICEYFIEDFCI